MIFVRCDLINILCIFQVSKKFKSYLIDRIVSRSKNVGHSDKVNAEQAEGGGVERSIG